MVTAVLTVAGLATRLLPWSYSVPKEMLPIPYNGMIIPVIQVVFSPDLDFILKLHNLKKTKEAEMLAKFYDQTNDKPRPLGRGGGQSTISFAPAEPNGFGGDVLAAEKYVYDVGNFEDYVNFFRTGAEKCC